MTMDEQRTAPTKTEAVTATRAALEAALRAAEPWGNEWATVQLFADLWRAADAEEGSVALWDAVSDAGDHARVALHGTRGYPLAEALSSLWTRWWLTIPCEEPNPLPDSYYRALSAAMQRRGST